MLHFPCMQNNLKKLRVEAGLKQNQLAELMDVAPSVVSDWENGKKSPSPKRIPKLAKILNCSELEVLGYAYSGVAIPILDWVSAGKMMSSDQHNGSSQQHDNGHILYDGKPNGKFALKVNGGSMNRMAPDGALIVVDSLDRDLVDGKPYVFCNVTSEETTFKLYKKDPIRLEPFSTEPDYENIKITSPRDNDEWQVIGRVIQVINNLRE